MGLQPPWSIWSGALEAAGVNGEDARARGASQGSRGRRRSTECASVLAVSAASALRGAMCWIAGSCGA
jgi:hypothetical protein